MGRGARIILATALIVLGSAPMRGDDSGLLLDAGVEKKLGKRTAIEAGVEYRSRHDFRTTDRVAIEVGGKYKVLPWLKLDAGYKLLIDNNREKISYNADGELNNWRPSYYATRHRLSVSATATWKVQRVAFSLRERWQYTYRPEHTTTRYDFDNRWWEETSVSSKNKHLLRSRLQVEWDIRKSKFTPWLNVELFTTSSLEKTRLQLGVDRTFKKRHAVGVFYRHQWVNSADDDELNTNLIGLSYKFKF